MDLKRIAKKYNVTVNDFECVYYDVFNKAKRFGDSFKDLFGKFLYDRLEELELDPRDVSSLVDYYTNMMEEYTSRQRTIVKKILNGDEPEQVIDEEMQTSGTIDSATNGRRKSGYTVKLVNEYQ